MKNPSTTIPSLIPGLLYQHGSQRIVPLTSIAISRRKNKSKNPGKGGDKTTRSKLKHPIQRRLHELGKTQQELAAEIGCTTATLRNLMRGDTRMKPATLSKLLKVLGVTENYLYFL
jgi:ribosome-binding protein aMBF1 (putative translation factor)